MPECGAVAWPCTRGGPPNCPARVARLFAKSSSASAQSPRARTLPVARRDLIQTRAIDNDCSRERRDDVRAIQTLCPPPNAPRNNSSLTTAALHRGLRPFQSNVNGVSDCQLTDVLQRRPRLGLLTSSHSVFVLQRSPSPDVPCRHPGLPRAIELPAPGLIIHEFEGEQGRVRANPGIALGRQPGSSS